MQRLPLLLIVSTLVLAVATVAYLPGLHSGFIFDDFGNLPLLGATGRVNSMPAFLRYITSGPADPTGRPLSLLTFLFNANNWPADPLPFKATNLFIQLLNGALLGCLLDALGQALGIPTSRRRLAALIAASAWVLHPFFVSTVLYVVQREAMLPCTFVAIGLLSWLKARRQFAEGNGRPWTLAAGIVGCTLLATLSKANGILLPSLVLICECVLPPVTSPRTAVYRRTLAWSCLPTTILVLTGLGWLSVSPESQDALAVRDWTIPQRLLTEPAILWHYLGELWLVLPTSGSLFHDQFKAATDLWHPWYTLPAILGWVALAGTAWHLRRRQPALALAVLFFLCGHLVESTSVALELYFEHRNYVPAMFIFWPAALAIAGQARRKWPLVLAAAALAVMATLTHLQALLWAEPIVQADEWARKEPASPRAQAYAAQLVLADGWPAAALRKLSRVRASFPTEPQVQMAWVSARCATGRLTEADVQPLATALRDARRLPGPELVSWLGERIDKLGRHACDGLGPETIAEWLDAAGANATRSGIAGRKQDVLYLRGRLALATGSPDAALANFNAALAVEPRPNVALNQAANLGAAGRPDLGLAHLDYYRHFPAVHLHHPGNGMPWVHDQILEQQNYWNQELEHLRETLQKHVAGHGAEQ
jgi:tetratricopeptide (TPR) repeat protein